MPRPKLLAIGTALLLTVSLAACGGGDDGGDGGDGGEDAAAGTETVSATDWATEVCGAVADWVTTIQEQSAAIGTEIQADPDKSQEVLGGFLGDAVAETDTLIETVDGAGVPDVEGGEAYAEELHDAFTEARGLLADVQTQIEDIDASSPAEFQKAASEIGPDIQAALTAVGSSVGDPESEELKKALDEVEACSATPGA